MKNMILVGTLMLGLGFAIGWVAKPVPLSASLSAQASAPPKKPDASAVSKSEGPPVVQGKRAERDTTPKNPMDRMSEEQRAQVKKMQAEMSKRMMKGYRAKFEQQIEKLAQNLNLSPEQKAALTAWLDQKMKKADEVDFSDPKSMAGFGESLAQISNKALEEQLAPTLSAEQKTALADFKERETRSKADTLALKSLSKMQGVIEFEEGQRDEVYKLLAEDAEKNVAASDEKPDPSSAFTEGMGIDMDPYDLGLQKAIVDSAGDPMKFNESGDKKAIAQKIRDAFDQRVEQRVQLLAPALNPKQLEQYRNELKTKGMGVYSTVLMGLEQ